MKIVIIEDELYTAKDLERTLLSIDATIEIVSILSSVEDGIEFLKKAPEIDLIFSDIQLGDGLSFTIYETVEVKAPIIYCTAYDGYALKAFKTLGIDYILKPFSQETVKLALNKFSLLKGDREEKVNEQSKLLSLLKQQLAPSPKSILIRKGDKITPLSVSDIALFYIHHDTVFAYTFKEQRHPLSQKLNELENQFSTSFFRTSRQHLVSRKAIKEAHHYFNRKLKVSLTINFQEDIIIGKLKATSFLEWMTQN